MTAPKGGDDNTVVEVRREVIIRVLREHGVSVTEEEEDASIPARPHRVTLLNAEGEPEVYLWPNTIGPQTIIRLARRYGHACGFNESDFYRAAREAAEVLAEFRTWPAIRFALYCFFNNCCEAGRMSALYGQRTDEQCKAAMEYQDGSR